MLTRHALTRRADEDGVDAPVVERDYVLAHVVAQLHRAAPDDGGRLVFKGGTAIRFVHLAGYRYSADLDFTVIDGNIANAAIALGRVIDAAREHAGFPHLERASGDKSAITYVGPLGAATPRQIKLDLTVPGHPPSYLVREERIVAAVDGWLNTLTDADHIDSTVQSLLAGDEASSAEPPEVTGERHREQRLQVELERVLAAIRAGMDLVLAAGQTRKIQADIAGARSIIDRWERSQDRPASLSEPDVRAVLADTRGIVNLLAAVDRIERSALYQELGFTLRYERES